jgi:CHAT domain-containing protein
MVADALCRRGASGDALRFAVSVMSARQSPDVAALARFVEGRRAPSASIDEALARAGAAATRAALLEAVAGAGDVESPFDRARLAYEAGIGFQRLDSSGDAATSFVAAATAAESIGWMERAADGLAAAAKQHLRGIDYAGARDVLERELALELRRGQPARAVRCRINLAGIDAQTGSYASACAGFESAASELARLGPSSRRDAITSLRNLGITCWRAGRYAKALEACRRAIDLTVTPGDEDLVAKVLLVEGDIELHLGSPERASAAHQRALAAAVSKGDPALIAFCRATLGNGERERGDYKAALTTYTTALAGLSLPAQEPLELRLLVNLTLVHSGLRDFAAARECGERAVALAEKRKDDQSRSLALQNLAQACRGAGDLKAAGAAAAAAVEIAQRLDSAQVTSMSWLEVLENATAEGDVPRAVEAARRSISATVAMTSGLAEGQGAEARQRHARIFGLAKAAALASGDPATVFEFAEESRAVDFLTSLEQGDAIRAAVIPRALREAEDEARVAEAAAALRCDAARTANDLALTRSRRAALDAARAKREAASERIRREVRSAAEMYPKPVGEADARAVLGAQDAFVIYVLTDERAAALVLTRDETRIVSLGAAKEVVAACAAWDPVADSARADAAISALKRTLVDPLGLRATTRVLVSPDGEVFRAPLAALFAGREVVHAPSASSYVRLVGDKALRGTHVLAVGAPDYAGRPLGALPESGEEAKSVGDVVVLGAAATEAGVRAAIAKEPRWRAIHIAAHGIVDSKRPMNSGLALTAAVPDDGLLTAQEIVGQTIPADMVVLSACDSGGGRVFTAEGLVGLPRAFLFSGTPRVIASSWRVDDAATRALMTKFYELWRDRGLRASAALAQAQDAVRSDERWRHPRYWAPWTLWGSGD